MADESIYTVEECLAEIKDIQAAMKEVRRAPRQQSIEGNFLSFSGQHSELVKELNIWKRHLRFARAAERDVSPMQGPNTTV